MSQSSSQSFNYGKRNFIRDLFRSVFSLIICCLLFSPLSVQAATGGGGSTRGGGAGSRGTIGDGSTTKVYLTQGFFSNLGGGEYKISTTNAEHYSAFIKINGKDSTMTAVQRGTPSICVYFNQKYWLSFYNWNGLKLTHLGNSPMLESYLQVDIPGQTTVIVVNSSTKQTGSLIFDVDLNKYNGDTGALSFTKYNNEWLLGLRYYTAQGKELYEEVTSSNSGKVGTKYYFDTYHLDEYTVTASTLMSGDYSFIFSFYDLDYKYLDSSTFVLTNTSADYKVINSNSNSRYMKVFVTNQSSYSYTAEQWKKIINISNLSEDRVTGTNYEIDNSSISTIINNHSSSTYNYNITSGDNSPITIIDGDNNTVTIEGASPITEEPSVPVIVDDGDNSDDGDDSGGLLDGALDLLKSIFDGLGDILAGVIEILLIPINFIVDALADTLELLKGVLQSLGGLAEFFGQVFFFLPSPIPEMLILFIPAILVVAIVKMFL